MRFRTLLVAEADSEQAFWLLSSLADEQVSLMASVRTPTLALAMGLEHGPDLALIGVTGVQCPMFTAGATLLSQSSRTRVLFYAPRLDAELIHESLRVGADGVASFARSRTMFRRVLARLLAAPEGRRDGEAIAPPPSTVFPTLLSADVSV